jgi:Glycosyltransferase 61
VQTPEVLGSESQGGVNLRTPQRGNVRLGSIARHLARAARGNAHELDEDIWALLTSGRVDERLRARAITARTTHPFTDGILFQPGEDLGPFYRWAEMEQEESVSLLDRPSYISPTGWVIQPPFQLVARGLLFKHFGVARPSVRKYCSSRLRRSAESLPPLLSLRDPTENNYYHLMCDILGGRLRMADEAGVGRDRPLLVSDAVHRHRNFQSLLRITDLGDREVIVQPPGRYIRTPNQPIVQTPRFCSENLYHLQRWLAVPEGDRLAQRRLFLVRQARTGRDIANMAAVAEVADRYGFELVSTEEMSLEAQIELFAQTRHIVGVWGSALFNMVWRRSAPLSVLEILPPLIRRPDAYWFYMARALGFRHYYYADKSLNDPYVLPSTQREMQQLKRSKRDRFDIDVDRLARLIETMLGECD